MDSLFADFEMYSYIILPLLIMLARICDVSIGTIRVMFIARGYRKLSGLLGFLEIMIWIFVGRQVLVKSTSIIHFIAYAAGFGVGNYIGLWIEDKMSIGIIMIRVILRKGSEELLNFLKEHEIGYTIVDGKGAQSEVKILFSVLQRQDLPEMMQALNRYNPKAFYSIEDVRTSSAGIFPHRPKRRWFHVFKNGRKAK
jgi:uncharacterized protein YebE (UPF0316 family)